MIFMSSSPPIPNPPPKIDKRSGEILWWSFGGLSLFVDRNLVCGFHQYDREQSQHLSFHYVRKAVGGNAMGSPAMVGLLAATLLSSNGKLPNILQAKM